MIIVSACLAGVNCKYSGGHNETEAVRDLVAKGLAIPVCPEQLGGCTTPRLTAEITGGTGADVLDGNARVRRIDGEDVTQSFIKGAEEIVRLARLVGAKKAVLKARSPSCGCGAIYDGTFTGKLIEGNGITAELLLRNGIEVKTEKD